MWITASLFFSIMILPSHESANLDRSFTTSVILEIQPVFYNIALHNIVFQICQFMMLPSWVAYGYVNLLSTIFYIPDSAIR